jgi:starch phosphorylase
MQGTSQATVQNFRDDFSFDRELPENLQALETLSWNYWWSWSTEGVNIFHDLDPQLWEDVEQNPRSMLRQISDLRLLQKANDPNYVERVAKLENDFHAYLGQGVKTLEQNGRTISAQHPVAYFCAEYGVHNSLPIYSGGLGILAGDHVKSASDLGLPLVAVGLMYRYGYFRQKLDDDKYQEEKYSDSFAGEMPLRPVLGQNGERIIITVSLANHPVHAQAWKVEAGKTLLYLLDTNIPQNEEADRPLTGYLYGGDRDTRVMQEILLGIGGVRLLRKLNIEPAVFHLNEGHSAFLTLELARELLKDNELTLDEVSSQVRNKCVFTTHTPIAAGNDVFPTDMIEKYFSTKLLGKLRISLDEFLHLGSSDAENGNGSFGMTPLAIRMCRSANGVSKKHGEVSREMWVQMFPQFQSAGEVPITHITNGVHAPTWIAPSLKTLYEKSIGENWQEILRDSSAWNEAVERIPDREIWQIHRSLKRHLIAFIRHQQMQKYGYEAADALDPNILTIGFARRVAAYKRWNLMLHDAERLYEMMDNAEGPVQFVFAGKPHPHDQGAKLILQELLRRQNPAWKQRSVFIEDYDQEVARFLVQGVDVWMNLPRRPLEASGTSGQKAAMNGALNLSIADGWWLEGYDANRPNGWVIGVTEDDAPNEEGDAIDDAAIDAADAGSLYSLLENEVIPTYYRRNDEDIPAEWLRMMKNSLQTLTYQFSSDRMLRDYVENIYLR